MTSALRLVLLAALLLTLAVRTALGLYVVLGVDGVGSQLVTDNGGGDLDPTAGVIDFVQTFGGKFQAEGRVQESSGVFGRSIFISATPPATNAIFRNTDTGDHVFTLTVSRSPFTEVVGQPLGWSVSYVASADDPMSSTVNIPSHSIALSINSPADLLTTLAGPPLSAAGAIATGTSGVDATKQATSMQVVWTFTAGPGDEILLPEDEFLQGNAIFVRVFNQEDRCIDRMNKRARKVAKKTAKAAEKCVKTVAAGGGGPSAQCTSDLTDFSIEQFQADLIDSFTQDCNPVPAWGVNAGTCCDDGDQDGASCAMTSPDCDAGGTCTAGACMSTAAEHAMEDIALDIFGGTALIGVDEVGKCQRQVIKSAGKLLDIRWNVLRKCKKNNVTSIEDDAELIAACLGPPQTDDGKIANQEMKVGRSLQTKCVDKGVVPVGSALPGGRCSAQPDAGFAACVNARVACRFCLAVNIADDLDPAVDCDLFDDGLANASCP